MDDTTIITDADYGFVTSSGGTSPTGVGAVISHGTSGITFYGSTTAPKHWYRSSIDADGAIRIEEVPPEPPKPEAKPKKPPPALPLECWHSKAFDADAAHAATLALCRGN